MAAVDYITEHYENLSYASEIAEHVGISEDTVILSKGDGLYGIWGLYYQRWMTAMKLLNDWVK